MRRSSDSEDVGERLHPAKQARDHFARQIMSFSVRFKHTK